MKRAPNDEIRAQASEPAAINMRFGAKACGTLDDMYSVDTVSLRYL